MKKVLLATSALVASAGIASADITLTGGADFGMKDTGVNGTDAYIHAETDFNIVATATTDNGYTIGASIDIDDDLSAAGSVTDTEITLSGDFGTLSFGELAAAQDGHGLADVGFDGIGIDDDVEARRTTSTADLKYATTFGDMSVTVTYALGTSAAGAATDGDYGILLGFDNAGFGVTVGMDVNDDGGANDTSTSLGLTYTVGEINLAGFFADDSTNSASGFSASYAMDANTTITGVYGSTDVAGDKSDYGIGFKTNLGGGVSFAGAVGSVDGNTVTDLGFNVAF
jgi:outer membrane protein OmpU